jgi:hypothetical protein
MSPARACSVRVPHNSQETAMEGLQMLVTTKTRISSDMVMESSTGSMELITKDSGATIRLKDRVLSGTPKEMYIEVNSKMIWLTAMENTLISTAASIRESSKTMCRRETEKKSGLTEPSTLVDITMV